MIIENVIIALIIAVLGPVITILIKYKLKNIKKTKESLRNHIFFNEIAYMIDVTSWKIDYEHNPIRSAMVRKFIRIKLKAIERNYKKLVDDIIDGKEIDISEYNNILTKIVVEYEREARDKKIPQVFINKFSQWHTPKIKQIREITEFIVRSSIYDDTVEKTSAILDIILMVLHLTLMDADNTLNNMNGDLDNVLKEMRVNDFIY